MKKFIILLVGCLFSIIDQAYAQTFINYTTDDGLVDNYVNAIAIDSAGNKWFGTPNGVSKFDENTWTTYTMEDGLTSNWVNAIAIDKEGNKWFGCQRYSKEWNLVIGEGVSKFDGTTWTNYSIADGLANNWVNAIAIDKEGNKWLAVEMNHMLKEEY